MVKPADRRPAAARFRAAHGLSERRACRLAGISRTGCRYRKKPDRHARLRARIRELAARHPRYGYRMLHAVLRREGWAAGRKLVRRLYREEKLQIPAGKHKKLVRPRAPTAVPQAPNVRWSMDFVSDQLISGRRFRVLNVADDYSREVVGQLAAFSITSAQAVRFLDQIKEAGGLPEAIVCDNGPEFTSRVMQRWSRERSVSLSFIQPGKPTQNAFIESLNGKFRNECLNQHWFADLEEARAVIDGWRRHYNQVRPHSSLNYQPPAAFRQAGGL